MAKIIVAGLGLLALVGVGLSAWLYWRCPAFNQGELLVNNHKTVKVALALTAAQKRKGLAGCRSLDRGEGMYFIFSPKAKAAFWMKDMVIPIDIIWITAGRVVGIERNVLPEDEGRLTKYYAPEAVSGVLEVGAGQARELGIEQGSKVVTNF